MQQKKFVRLRLLQARESRGWTQQRLADEVGTTFVSVSRWETGARTPSPYFRRKLVTLFATTEEELDLVPPPTAPVTEAVSPPASSQNRLLWWYLPNFAITTVTLIAAGMAWYALDRRSQQRKPYDKELEE